MSRCLTHGMGGTRCSVSSAITLALMCPRFVTFLQLLLRQHV